MQTSYILPEPTTPNVLVHYHMMKNSGTTVAAILQREFGEAYAEIHGPDPGSMITTAELLAFIKEHPHVRAISSHHTRFPVPSEDRLHFAYCCFVRHPLDRLYSLYSFFRSSGDASEVGQMARRLSPPDFFSEMVDRFPNYICNAQTSFLACHGFFLRPCDREDLRVAIDVIRQCTLPGVVHRTNESLAVGEYFLGPLFPGIRLHSPAQNVTLDPSRSLPERERHLKDVFGRVVYGRLAKLNRLDLELTRRAEDEIERRKQLVPSFVSRFADFEQRCNASRS